MDFAFTALHAKRVVAQVRDSVAGGDFCDAIALFCIGKSFGLTIDVRRAKKIWSGTGATCR